MTRMIVHGRTATSYKEAQDLYKRAVAILEHKRGGSGTILKSEAAALYYGFMLLNDDGGSEGFGPVWDDVGEAGKLALNGYGVKQGSVRPCKAPLDEDPDA